MSIAYVLDWCRPPRNRLWEWRVSNEYGDSVHTAADEFERLRGSIDSTELYRAITKAIDRVTTAILQADDSSGIIGDGVRRLLALHAEVANEAMVKPRIIVEWLLRYHFDGKQDYFHADPLAYEPALGSHGMTMLKAGLDAIAARGIEFRTWERRFDWRVLAENAPTYELTFVPTDASSPLRYFAERLAVRDRDSKRIVELVAGGLEHAGVAKMVALALLESGDIEGARDWAWKGAQGTGNVHLSMPCAKLWCALLAEHWPGEEFEALRWVMNRFGTLTAAADFKEAAGERFHEYAAEVQTALERRPEEWVTFLYRIEGDADRAWHEAERLQIDSPWLWEELCSGYGHINPAVVLPVLHRLVNQLLEHADAKNYVAAAAHLVRARDLAAAVDGAADFEQRLEHLRDRYRNRPRMLKEFARAGL